MIAVWLRNLELRLVVLGFASMALCACGQQGAGVADEREKAAAKKADVDAVAVDDDRNSASEREAKRTAAAKAQKADDDTDDAPAKAKVSANSGKTTVSGTEAGEPDREGEDWPRFLGPHGAGVSNETGLLESWPKDGLKILWEKTIGTGYSAPSIRGNRLVIPHRIGRKEIIECVRADDGEPIWKHDYKTEYADPYGYNNGPRCSPVLTEDRCYTFGAEGKLVCTDLKSGARVWARDVQADFKLPQWFFGIGCSPVLEGKLVIALVGGQPNSGVVAFDKDTGATVWEAVGKKTWDGEATGWPTPAPAKVQWTGEEQVVSYSSPIVATIHGKRHLLMVGRQGLVSLDPATGKENFHHFFMSRDNESVNAARPLVVGDQIFLSAAYLVGSTLLKVKPDGKGYDVVWKNPRNMLNHWSTSLHVDGFLYGFSGRHENEGELRCLDLKTGTVQWATKGTKGADDAYGRGSKIRTGDRFIVLGERGVLALVKVNPEEWQEEARASYPQITYPVWTAPVLSRKRLYLRDEDTLLCLELAPEKAK